jgi:hypothetical protein
MTSLAPIGGGRTLTSPDAVPAQGRSRCHGSSAAGARGTCDRCDQKTRPPGPANGLPIAAEAIEP